jgi:predicted nucleic acid-binding protein
MPFVLDASVTLAWCFHDEATAYADRALDRLNDDSAIAPVVWPLEVANALWMAERRQRLQAAQVNRALALIQGLPVSVDTFEVDRVCRDILSLARAQSVTAYDASYLELAMREGLPLATQDGRMLDAAIRLGLPILR